MFIPKQHPRYLGIFLLLLTLVGVAYWLHDRHSRRLALQSQLTLPATDENGSAISSPIAPLPTLTVNQARAELGKRLFFDPRLSRNNSMNCASCHSLSNGGADGKQYSLRADGTLTTVNTPSVFNAGLRSHQFWDGRAETLEEQVVVFFQEHQELGLTWDEVAPKLKADQDFVRTFTKTYADGLTLQNVANALAEFQRTLTTPNARFDRYLRGDQNAINADEKRGYKLFSRYGCVACHQGRTVGGNMFEQMGSINDYFAAREKKFGVKEQTVDFGRFNVTHQERDRHTFEVCSLRNVEKTAPYFHDGSAATLEDAINTMSYYNLGINIPKDEVSSIAAFLRTLTGEYQGQPL